MAPPDPQIVDNFVARRHLRAAFDLSERTLRALLRDHPVRTFTTPGGEKRYSLADLRQSLGLDHATVPSHE